MAEGVRIVAECDGFAAPWEGAQRIYRFGAGTVLLLLRKDDRRFLKVAYDGQPLFVPRAACVEVKVTTSTQLSTGAEALDPEQDRQSAPPVPWVVRESVVAITLSVLVPVLFVGLFVLLFPLANYAFSVVLIVWALVVLFIAILGWVVAGSRAAVWGTFLGLAITTALVLSGIAMLSNSDL